MTKLDGRSAWILLTVLALTAVVGFEQGLVRALAAAKDAGPAAAADPGREPVPSAQPLASAPLDEAQVRLIARQEAEAALARSRPKKPAPAESDATADPSTDPQPLTLPPVSAPTPSPAQPAASPQG